MKKIAVLTLFLLIWNNMLTAQNDELMRVEIEAKSYSTSYNIIPVGNKGVLLFSPVDRATWEFTLYDTGFKEKWSQKKAISGWLPLRRQFFSEQDGAVYLLFMRENITLARGDFEVVKIDIGSKEIQSLKGKFLTPLFIKDFKVVNDVAFFGGYSHPKTGNKILRTLGTFAGLGIPLIFGIARYSPEPALITTNFTTEKIDNINLKQNGPTKIFAMNTNHTSQTIDVFINNYPDKENYNVAINEITGTGNVVNKINFKTDKSISLTSGKVLRISNSEKLVIGTYAAKPKKIKEPVNIMSGSGSDSEGMYIAKFIDNEQVFLKFYSFSKFENLFSYLSSKSRKRLETKKRKAAARGKKMAIDYSLLVHDIIRQDDKYIMVAEAYYPEYHTECYTTYSANGIPQTTCYTVFDGYRYTHAITAGFSPDGELLWDNSFEIWDVLTYNLKERVKTFLDQDELVLVYSYGGAIQSKTFLDGKVVEEKDETEIETFYEGDKVRSNYASDIDIWYDNYFIAYGYQRIKGRDPKSKKTKRTVFYFNKIAFE